MRALTIALGILLTAGFAPAQGQAQPPPPQPAAPPAPTGPAPTGLVVGSGNFFSPIVRDLDAAVAFYRDGLGSRRAGRTGDADATLRCATCSACPTHSCAGRSARPP